MKSLSVVKVSLLLTLSACGVQAPSEPQEEPRPTSPDIIAPPAEGGTPVPSALVVPLAAEQQAEGAVVTVSRLHDSRPAQESVHVLPAGTQNFTVATGQDEVLAITVQSPEGSLAEFSMVSASSTPKPGKDKRLLRVPKDYPTIQAAIDAADWGDTVLVSSGTWRESVRLKSGIKLLGSGAPWTILDGEGRYTKLVDFTGAEEVVIAGFTFQNVGAGGPCDRDVLACSGNWYSAGVYADGHQDLASTPPTSALVTQNIFRGNFVGMMVYFHARAVVRNNLFINNVHGFVANHFQDTSLVANNVFYHNDRLAIANQAAYLDILNNAIIGSDVGILYQYIQTGRVRCNLFYQNGSNGADIYRQPPRFAIGADGNVEAEPLFRDAASEDFRPRPGSPLVDAGCHDEVGFDLDGSRQDIGAHGGPLGRWP